MKKIFVLLSIFVLLTVLIATGNAEKAPENASADGYSNAVENSSPDEKGGTQTAAESSAPAEYYARVWNAADGETKRLMEAIGVTADGGSFDGLTPGSVLKAVYSLFKLLVN